MTSSVDSNSSVRELISAIERDEVGVVHQMLLKRVGSNTSLDDDIGTALHVAARHNSVGCVDLLLSMDDTVIDMVATEHMQTPLMTAAAHGHATVLRRLLAAGANVNQQTPTCSTPLILACHYGHVECAHVLLDCGADPEIINPWGYNALYMATDVPEILNRLLTYNSIDVDKRCGTRNETALHLAAVIGSTSAIWALLERDADINARTAYNENALWLAAWRAQSEAARLLIQNNVELDVPSNGCQVYVKHYLPIEVALGLELYDVVHLLLLAGCSLFNPHLVQTTPVMADMTWVHLHAEAFDFIKADPENLRWLHRFLRNPLTLKDICRRLIRHRLGTPLVPKIDKLECLPRVIKDIIAMKDI